MPYPSTITLDDASGDDSVFNVFDVKGQDVIRREQTSTASFPYDMAVRHNVAKSGGVEYDRHNIAFTKRINTADEPVSPQVSFTVAVPRVAEVTNQIMIDMVANLLDHLLNGALTTPWTSTNLDILLRGES